LCIREYEASDQFVFEKHYCVLQSTKLYPYICSMSESNKAKAQMRKGVLELCVLRILKHQEAYTSDVINALKKVDLLVVEGTLYPLLTRMKNADMLKYRWEESPSGPPRMYYRITKKGQNLLTELETTWVAFVDSVNSLNTPNSTKS
jgi:PadR family transcriptional regulator PadR